MSSQVPALSPLGSMPEVTGQRAPSARTRRATNPAAISARSRFAGVCWKVAELAKQQQVDKAQQEETSALESLKILRADLSEMRDAPLYETARFKMRTWVVIEASKILLLALGTVVGLAQTGYDTAQAISPKKDSEGDECQPEIGSVAFAAAITIILGISLLLQGSVDVWEGIHKIREQQRQDEEKKFINTMDHLLQNVEWLLEADKGNSVLCHRYIASCYKYIKQLPDGYVDEHEELKTLITNLVTLLPEGDELKRTLTDLGSTIKDKEKPRRQAVGGSAPAAVFLDPSGADRGGMMRASTVFEIKQVPQDQLALWTKLEGIMGCPVDSLDFNGVELVRPGPNNVIKPHLSADDINP